MSDKVENLYTENQKKLTEDAAAYEAGTDGFPTDIPGMENFKMPSAEDLVKMLDGMEGLSEDEKEKLKLDILGQTEKVQESVKEQLENFAQQQKLAHSSDDMLIFTTMVGLIVLIFVLFGYKLYQSLMSKQRKREEKLKAKQEKKKKK